MERRRRGGWDNCSFADEMYRFDDEPNFASFVRASKAGNPEAVLAFTVMLRRNTWGCCSFAW